MPELEIPLNSINEALLKIQDKEVSDLCIGEILNRYSRFTHSELNESLLPLINKAEKISNSIDRCITMSYSYILLKNDTTGKFDNLTGRTIEGLRSSWDSIDIEWEQIDTGFKIVKTIASSSIEISQQFLSEIEDKRKNIVIDSGPVAFFIYKFYSVSN